MEQALEWWSPDIIIPCDEPALKNLLRPDGRSHERRQRIARSVGGPEALAVAGQKSKLIALAAAEGLAVPTTEKIGSARDLLLALRSRTYPVVLKLDWTWGGNGVKICVGATRSASLSSIHTFQSAALLVAPRP